MITIVKTEPHLSVIKEAVCRNCGATLNYVPIDVKNRIECDYGGGRDYVSFITCPRCNNDITVGRV